MKFTIKMFLKWSLPILGIGSIVGCTIPLLLSKPIEDGNQTNWPKQLSVSGGVEEINAKTNTKTIANKPFIISVEPSNASHTVRWTISDNFGNAAPEQIYINEGNYLVVDKGVSLSLDATEYNIVAAPRIDLGGTNVSSSPIKFILHVIYEPTNVIDIRFSEQGSTQFISKISQKTYADKPYIAEVQSKLGIWELGKVNYSIFSIDGEASTFLAVDNDGYLYSNGVATHGRDMTIQIKATSIEDNTFTILSNSIQVIFQGDDSSIASLKFINGDEDVGVNFGTHKISAMPYIVSAYDQFNVLIPEPKIAFYLIGAPSFVNIDRYGYLDVNAVNINSYVNTSFQLIARSTYNSDVTISMNINLVIADFTSSEYYKFDANTGTLLGFQPKFYSYLVNQQGNITLPSTINDTSVVKISDSLFKDIKELKTIILPSTITSIGNFCFQDCSNLTSITINSNPSVGGSAFTTGGSTTIVINDQSFVTTLSAKFLQMNIVTGSYSVSLGGSYQVSHSYDYISTVNFSTSAIWSPTSKKTIITFGGTATLGNIQSLANNAPQYYSSSTQLAWTVEYNGFESATWNIFTGYQVQYWRYYRDINWTKYTLTTSSSTPVCYSSVWNGTTHAMNNIQKNYPTGSCTMGFGYLFSTGERGRWKQYYVGSTTWTSGNYIDEFWDWNWW